jgi:hypothetical protein
MHAISVGGYMHRLMVLSVVLALSPECSGLV